MQKHAPILIGILLGALGIMIPYVAAQAPDACLPSFHDEFSSHTLDTTKWSTAYPSGNGGERQYYGSDAFSLGRGVLSISAREEPSHGYPYTSGMITTQSSFAQAYGFFVIRARVPRGKGFWPAFWLLPANKQYPLEIDVLEVLGYDPYTVYMSNHWPDAQGAHQQTTGRFTSNTDLSGGFHTFAIDWQPSEINWYIDGNLQFRTDYGIPSEPMFLLANLAVGGTWPGYPDRTTPFPGTMQIDYIRVFPTACSRAFNSR